MGDQKINLKADDRARVKFLVHLIEDINCLEHMFENRIIEDDIIRIGAEQEICLVNEEWRPANNAVEVLKDINDPHFTTELALYNLEINLDPIELVGDAFSKVENQLVSLFQKAKKAADNRKSKTVLAGILPSISKPNIQLDYMTPMERYFGLNELLKQARGGAFKLHIMGVDELSMMHNSVMFEACNTSFQLHLQIDPQDFVSSYNWAQAIAGPVLGACVNSPLLMGKELWSETRIALFQQSVDTRNVSTAQIEKESRVSFGSEWLEGSIVDFYKNEISHFTTILTKEIGKSSLKELDEGVIPKLAALNLMNGTIYKWNRPCYGVGNGKPHIRIENRYIPAGPSLIDEIANFAFWVGLMQGRPKKFDDITQVMEFRDAKSNFIRAARTGSESVMNWMGKRITLDQLVLNELIPIARAGLERMKIDKADIDKYLSIIEARFSIHTGSQWLVNNYNNIKKKLKRDDALIALTSALHENQNSDTPISKWPPLHDFSAFNSSANTVGHIMTSDLLTAAESDLGLLTLQYMKWNNIHHLPVVDNNENLVGLITWKHLKKYWEMVHDPENLVSAREIMVKDVITVETSTPIKKAIELMKKHEIGCLPILHGRQLVGIVSIKDLVHLDND